MIGKCNTGGENVKAEVTAQTPIIADIAENFGVEITTPTGTNKQILQGNNANLQSIKTNAKKEGLYVWKKYSGKPKITAEIIVDFESIPEIYATTYLTVTSSDPLNLPVSELDVSSFDGLTLKQTIDFNSYRTFTFHGDGTVTRQTDSSATTYADGTFTYDKSAGRIKWTPTTAWGQHSYEFSSVYVEKTNELLDYVVSDSETAYPDGGEQGGYWYEKVTITSEIANFFKSKGYKVAIDTVLFTSSQNHRNLKINHSLGIEPIMIIMIASNPNDLTNTDTVYSYLFAIANSTSYAVKPSDIKAYFSSYGFSPDAATETYIIGNASSDTRLYGGVEYTLITIGIE